MTARSILTLCLTLALGATSLLRAEITEEMARKLFSADTPFDEFQKLADEVAKL